MSCPICKKISNIICDNDCGTLFCSEHGDFYKENEEYKLGHSSHCGKSDDESDVIKITQISDDDKYKC